MFPKIHPSVIAAFLILSPPLLAAETTLREAAGPGIDLGCAIATRDLADEKLTKIIVEQFNCLTPEYDLMPALLVDADGKYSFENGDRVVAFAEKNELPVYGHMLIWHHVTRAWLFEDDQGEPLPREQALENLENYISTVVGHYKGRIKAWNVVNEGLSDNKDEYLRDSPAFRAIGEDYIARAFEFAHRADPEAELYYNDYNIEQPDKLAKTLKLIKSLQDENIPLNAVGIQGHWLLDWPPTEMIGKGIDAIAETGVDVMITELDVDPLPRETSGADMQTVEEGANPYPDEFPDEAQQALAKRYREIMTEIVSHPEITMIGFWGTHDGRSWLNDFPVKGRTNHPLLFDRELKKKPAFEAVRDALETR